MHFNILCLLKKRIFILFYKINKKNTKFLKKKLNIKLINYKKKKNFIFIKRNSFIERNIKKYLHSLRECCLCNRFF